MSDILCIIEKYQDMDESVILSHPDLAEDINSLQVLMTDASAQDNEQALLFLRSIMINIESEIQYLVGELEKKTETFETIQNSTKACLAYLKPTDKKG